MSYRFHNFPYIIDVINIEDINTVTTDAVSHATKLKTQDYL